MDDDTYVLNNKTESSLPISLNNSKFPLTNLSYNINTEEISKEYYFIESLEIYNLLNQKIKLILTEGINIILFGSYS